jgi:hypothetical protein
MGFISPTRSSLCLYVLQPQVIADELLAAADALEASYKDPYSDPIYSMQLAKVEAKAQREAARAAAAAAKAARLVSSGIKECKYSSELPSGAILHPLQRKVPFALHKLLD